MLKHADERRRTARHEPSKSMEMMFGTVWDSMNAASKGSRPAAPTRENARRRRPNARRARPSGFRFFLGLGFGPLMTGAGLYVPREALYAALDAGTPPTIIVDTRDDDAQKNEENREHATREARLLLDC